MCVWINLCSGCMDASYKYFKYLCMNLCMYMCMHVVYVFVMAVCILLKPYRSSYG